MTKDSTKLKVTFKLSKGLIQSTIVSADSYTEAVGIVYFRYCLGKFLKIIDVFPVDENGNELDLFYDEGVLKNGKEK